MTQASAMLDTHPTNLGDNCRTSLRASSQSQLRRRMRAARTPSAVRDVRTRMPTLSTGMPAIAPRARLNGASGPCSATRTAGPTKAVAQPAGSDTASAVTHGATTLCLTSAPP